MKVAILGATSEIAKDLIRWFSTFSSYKCILFARRVDVAKAWQVEQQLANRYPVMSFDQFLDIPDFEVIINFVGVGNPAVAAEMGASILDVTAHYDNLALTYIKKHPYCRYTFLSSGAVYGGSYDAPVTNASHATFPINIRENQNWYSVAKFCAEMRHRALSSHAIVDIRVFSYISRFQDTGARFLITDMLRSIQKSINFETSMDNFYRDYLSPSDFCQLVSCILNSAPKNIAIDCFTKAPVDKYSLLASMSENFGLKYTFSKAQSAINVTGLKPNYFSTNHIATEFGYAPKRTALEAVVEESSALLKQKDILLERTTGVTQ